MSFQYPDTITVFREPEIEEDENHNLKPVPGTEDFNCDCRGEPAGSNPIIPGKNGDSITYSWIVYMPKTSEVFEFGDKIELIKEDGSIYKSSLKRQYNGKFNTTLWV